MTMFNFNELIVATNADNYAEIILDGFKNISYKAYTRHLSHLSKTSEASMLGIVFIR